MKKFAWTVGVLVALVATMGVANANGKLLKGVGDFAAPIVKDKEDVTAIVQAGSVVYDTAGTGFFGLAPDGTWIAMGLKPTTVRPEIRVTGGSGLGSTGTTVRRFTNIVVNNGLSAIAYTQDSVNGDKFTVNESGVYAISYQDSSTTDGGMVMVISRNSTQLNVAPSTLTIGNIIAVGMLPATYKVGSAATTIYLNAGDVIRAQVDTSANEAADIKVRFSITKITD